MTVTKKTSKKIATRRNETDERLEQAQMLVFDAWEAPTPAKAQALARKALNISMDCADAYALLASFAKTDAEALSLLRSAVDAGERSLGPDAFKSMAGKFWGFLETRPFMRALALLGHCYESLGCLDDAISCYRRMLELNPNDNQGARYWLFPLFVMLDRDGEAEDLHARYKEDGFAHWLYGRVLLDFRKHGPGEKAAEKNLGKAMKANPHVVAFLTGRRKVPKKGPLAYSCGSEEEALVYMRTDEEAWIHTSGAIKWLTMVTKQGLHDLEAG